MEPVSLRQAETKRSSCGMCGRARRSGHCEAIQNGSTGSPLVKLWDVRPAEGTTSLKGHTGTVFAVAISSDGTNLASAGEDNTIKLWDAQSGHEITTLTGHKSPVHDVAFMPDGTHLVSACADGTVKLWETHTGRDVSTLVGQQKGANNVAFAQTATLLRQQARAT